MENLKKFEEWNWLGSSKKNTTPPQAQAQPKPQISEEDRLKKEEERRLQREEWEKERNEERRLRKLELEKNDQFVNELVDTINSVGIRHATPPKYDDESTTNFAILNDGTKIKLYASYGYDDDESEYYYVITSTSDRKVITRESYKKIDEVLDKYLEDHYAGYKDFEHGMNDERDEGDEYDEHEY